MDLLVKAITAATKGGFEIMKVYESEDFDVSFKEDQSPLTLADKKAHNIISELLESTGYPILSEEGKSIPYDERKKWDTFWLIDPLDGTKEFIKRNGEFTVNIALVKKNAPIMGVIYVPVTGELYYGNHLGSFKYHVLTPEDCQFDELRQHAIQLPLQKNSDTFQIVGSRSHMSEETKEYIDAIDAGGKTKEIISVGSSLKICLVAEGSAEIYPRLAPTMEWDIAAGNAIARYAGKKIVNFETGEYLTYNKENLLNPWFIVK